MESTSPEKGGNDYEAELAHARQAQADVDRAIEELRQVQRFLAEAPSIIAARRRAAEQAHQSLTEAEGKLEGAREIMSAKQMEVALLMEKAASHQQALARSLSPGQEFPDMNEPGGPAFEAAAPQPEFNSPATRPPKKAQKEVLKKESRGDELTAPAWPTTYAFPGTQSEPAFVEKKTNEPVGDVVEFLRERDLPCPSCDYPLRGLNSSKCQKCGMALSVSVLKTNMPPRMTKRMWAVRGIAAVAFLMSLYLAFSASSGRELFLCGRGSGCDEVFSSAYSKIRRIPVAILGVMVFGSIGLSTFFIGVGKRDKTRRFGWSALTLLALIAGGGGLWFIFVQLVLIGGICPHCMLVDVCGLALAFLVLRQAPLMRDEVLGHSAVGPLNFSKKYTIGLAGIALFCVAGFIGANTLLRGTQLHRVNTGQKTGKKQTGNLMMKGLPSSVVKKKTKSKNEPAKQPKANSPKTTPTKTDTVDKKDKKTEAKKDQKIDQKIDQKKDEKKTTGGGLLFKPAPSVLDD